RPELQGLRALAALLVVVYHVWFGRISGGVDVFFVISGFLITGQLVRVSVRGRIEFGPLWARMIKRLFPAALTVLFVVMVASWLFLPETRWFQTIREVFASALYVENWQLVANSVDYFAQHTGASVVQHFWSLSIQGQFYVVWPVLIAVVVLVARRAGWGLHRSVGVVLAVLFVGSLGLSVWLTVVNQPLAYFHSGTRVWEFALGGLVALVIDRVVLPVGVRVVLGWAGVAGLVLCGLVLQVGTVFPGYAALWPTVSAVLVLVAGATGSGWGADRVLGSRLLRSLGDYSYALYLWHWPVLLFYLVIRDRVEVGLLGGAFVIGLSLGLSVLTYHFIETPVREGRFRLVLRGSAYRFAVVSLVPVLVTAGAWQVAAAQRASYTVPPDDPDHPGAASLLPGFEYQGADTPAVAPRFISLPDQFAGIDEERCHPAERNEELVVCRSRTEGPPVKRLVVVGDSHAQQFLGALLPAAERNNWEVVSMVLGRCPFSTGSETMPGSQSCLDWNADAVDEIAETAPDAVFTTATREMRPGRTEMTPPGYVEQWRKLDALGIPVVAARDNPRFDFWPSNCVEVKGLDAKECTTPRSEVVSPEPPYTGIPDIPPNVSFVDFTDFFCPEEACPAEVGNVLVYMDDNHVTKTYMRTLSPMVERELVSALRW
ncbi:Peptidoglycan/LPS O-acetylase OafA/YrhL, contains acyltransferase and SGNH-hydrolase domains, partial [Amycolatopsis marina]